MSKAKKIRLLYELETKIEFLEYSITRCKERKQALAKSDVYDDVFNYGFYCGLQCGYEYLLDYLKVLFKDYF